MKYNKQSRRQFLKKTALTAGGLSAGAALPAYGNKLGTTYKQITGTSDEGEDLPRPTQAQIDWQDCEVGLIYHFDISVAVGRHESGNNAYREVFDPKKYNPEKLDTDQWIEAAKAAGAKYAVFTATHFNGFLQWQSDAYPYGLKQARWKNGKGDIVGDFVNSCHKAGIKPGIYLSTHRNAYWELWDYYVNWGKGKGTKEQEKFNRAAEHMLTELCSRYGPIVQIWFDAGTKIPSEGGPDVLPIFDKYQPHSVFYHCSKRADHRWIGNESGYANYPCWATMPHGEEQSHNAPSWRPILETGDPDGKIWSPGMVDVPLRGTNGIHNWFWAPGQDKGVYSKDQLVKMYYDSVARNCNFIVGEVVNPEGLVPEYDIQELAKFGDEIKRRFDKPVGKTTGVGRELTLELRKPQKIDHVVIQEQLEHGERIRSYTVEGKNSGNNWEELCSGISVGHKRIQRFDPRRLSAIRLKIDQAKATPVIRNLAVYHSGNKE